MGKTVKNLIMAFTLICAIMLVFLVIELILLNRDPDAGDAPGSTVSGGQPAGDRDTPPTSGAAPPDTSPPANNQPAVGTDSQPETNPQGGAPSQATGRRHELLMAEKIKLVLHADEGLFEYSQDENGWWFHYKGGGSASLEIGFDFMPPQGISACTLGRIPDSASDSNVFFSHVVLYVIPLCITVMLIIVCFLPIFPPVRLTLTYAITFVCGGQLENIFPKTLLLYIFFCFYL